MKKLQNRKGFTLVELLVVMAIIGILLLIAIPRLTESTRAARIRVMEANARVLAGAATTFFAQNQQWPNGVAGIVTGGFASEETFGTDGATNTQPAGAVYTFGTYTNATTAIQNGQPGNGTAAGVSAILDNQNDTLFVIQVG